MDSRVRHEMAIPPGFCHEPISNHTPSPDPPRIFGFELDPFQRVAMNCIERNESVLVSAHTSAGKTVVAEYAIAMALRNKQRVIYTSPIKALSNQKYRELKEEFKDVGLLTGDITLDPESSCIVMTTEILRSMLYRGSEIVREVSWVIFDEIHYMRDKERGVVWEEAIILLPHSVRYVFLSATIPNARQFAEWICKLHTQACHVVYTDFRPTPLQHYLFPSGGDGIHLVVDEHGRFREDNFQKALSSLSDQDRRKSPDKRGTLDLYKIIRMIMSRNNHPVIVFSFSKLDCEAKALQIAKIDFNSPDEKKCVEDEFAEAIESLLPEDRVLEQIKNILPLLKRGIGIHHSGLLPILKEVIEILFQRGLLKVLFATETFSIGLNMPAKTVIFTSVRKFDGKDFRWISSGEYIQMSGRAGRRGLDDRGIVILMVNEKMEPAVCKNMIKGEADRLFSAFYLSYNMILNLMRVEGTSPENMLEQCFLQFQSHGSLPDLESRLQNLAQKRDAMVVLDQVKEYVDCKAKLDFLSHEIERIVQSPDNILPWICPGRIVQIKIDGQIFDWGCILGSSIRKADGKIAVLVHAFKDRPCFGNEAQPTVINTDVSAIQGVGSVKLHVPSGAEHAGRKRLGRSILEARQKFLKTFPPVDLCKNLDKDPMFVQMNQKKRELEEELRANPISLADNLEEMLRNYKKKHELEHQILQLEKQAKQAKSVVQMEELKCRERVLRRLGYTTAEDMVETKGRVACEISTGDELVLTEMIFNGAFNHLSVEQTTALLSCFVFQEKSEQEIQLKEELAGPLAEMRSTARRIAQVAMECKMDCSEEEYVGSFRPEMMDAVFAWTQGAKFAEICKMTDVFEGSIIRCMRRLEELLRQMCQAAKNVGNTHLEAKFSEAITRIKRDIVFASSLYFPQNAGV